MTAGAVDWQIETVEACDSTQEILRERAHAGAAEGTAIVATRMDDGRGTHGRAWHAPEGGLYLSFLLRDAIDPVHLSLAVGNAVADVLEVAGAEPRMKWVNDVLVDGKKIAGTLIEAESTGDHIDAVLVGIGINVNGHAADFPAPLHDQATTLEDVLGADSCIPDLQAYLLESLQTWLHRLRQGDVGHVLATWRGRDALQGQQIGFDPDGDFCTKILGTVQGIDDEGRLLLDVDGQVQAHRTGSIVTR